MRRSWVAESLLVMCWGIGDDDHPLSNPCFQTLVEEIKKLPPWLTRPGYDAVISAINRCLLMASSQSENERFLFFCLIIRRLRTPDAVRAVQVFVIPTDLEP